MTVAKNTTGCSFLDKIETEPERIAFCLRCPDKKSCVLDSQKERKGKHLMSKDKEVWVMCKNCGVTETLTIRKGKLLPAERWQQKGNKIRHMIVCGEAK